MDIAGSHIRSLNPEVQGKQRIIVYAENPMWNDAQKIAKELFPNSEYNFGNVNPVHLELDNSRSKKVLGLEYNNCRTMIEELVHQMLDPIDEYAGV